MNSIKNTIVTITLLAVSYGAYVVLSNPQHDAEVAQLEDWPGGAHDASLDTAPTVTIPDIQHPDMQFPDETGQVNPDAVVDAQVNATSAETPSWDDPLPGETQPSQATDTASPVETADVNSTETRPSHHLAADTQDYPSTDAPSLPRAGNSATSESANAFEEAWKSIQSNVSSGQLDDALFALSIWYREPSLTAEQSERCTQLLDDLAGTVIYSQKNFMEPAYVVQQGETLEQIAQQYHVPVEFLARINGIEAPFELFPGESLKVVKGPFRAVLDYQRSEITLYLGRYYAGRFVARIGGEMPKNVADFEVVVKEPGREFFDRRTGFRVARDDPQNPYGDRWIGLRGDQITAAHNVGIHVDTGNLQAGCIAVNRTDADDLTAILSIGSRVTIKR